MLSSVSCYFLVKTHVMIHIDLLWILFTEHWSIGFSV